MATDSSNIAIRYLQRRVLLLTLIPMGVLFALTVTLAGSYHAHEEELVRSWFKKGTADLAAGQPRKAFEDFRNALSYDSENHLVQLRLAEALLADGQLTEARSYLMNLWDRTPGSGEVNEDLAHVSVQMLAYDDAIRYFRAAIFGSWENNPSQQRRNVRMELCQFLLAQGRIGEADTELMALAADIPPEDVSSLEKTGDLFLKAGQPKRALTEFETALRNNPRQNQLLEEAGGAAFAAAEYSKAVEYLGRAVRGKSNEESLENLRTAREVLSGDPLEPGLSVEDQAGRTWRAFQRGLDRLQQCSGTAAQTPSSGQPLSDLQTLIHESQELKKHVTLSMLSRHPDLRGQTMQFVFRVEENTAPSCGQPTPQDRALVLIKKRHEANNS
jgi:tetratricopeptide (TPR) repeat protein